VNATDIVYTPLDLPPCPDVDIDKLEAWMESVYPQEKLINHTANSYISGENQGTAFPWNVIFAKAINWQNNFKEEFPELVKYVTDVWGIPEHELLLMVLLPKRLSDTAADYWHSDKDKLGLRFYISFENTKTDKLLFKKTLSSECKDSNLFRELNTGQGLENKVHEAVLVNNKQPYYLNNYLAAHNVDNKTKERRIAVILATAHEVDYNSKIKTKLEQLIVDSAMKYHEEAIFWHDWSDALSNVNP
jgi:hypothetical protein